MDQFENKNHENVEERSDERKQHVQYYADGQMAGSREELESKRKHVPKDRKKLPGWAMALIIIGAVILCIILLTVGCTRTVDKITQNLSDSLGSAAGDNEVITDFGHDYIGVIHIEGTISEDSDGTYNQEYLLNAVDAMMGDSENKGMILYVDSREAAYMLQMNFTLRSKSTRKRQNDRCILPCSPWRHPVVTMFPQVVTRSLPTVTAGQDLSALHWERCTM